MGYEPSALRCAHSDPEGSAGGYSGRGEEWALLVRGNQGPQGDRIAKPVESGNAVLPDRARRPRKQISRARLGRERRTVPSLARLAAKAQCAGCKQRQADDYVELRLVPMPADSRAGPIFVDENLAEGFIRAIENLGDLAPQGNEKRRKRFSLND